MVGSDNVINLTGVGKRTLRMFIVPYYYHLLSPIITTCFVEKKPLKLSRKENLQIWNQVIRMLGLHVMYQYNGF